jgi:phosphoglycerate dehydrogenase-like enzyme
LPRSLRIVISDTVVVRYGVRLRAGLEPADEVVAVDDREPLPPACASAEVVAHGYFEGALGTIDGILAAVPAVRWIHSFSAGIDRLDLKQLAGRGVLVTNSAGVYAPGMAEFALAGLVWMSRRLGQWHDPSAVHDGVSPVGHELHGKRVGIVGYGAVGRRVATVCRALGMEVWATRRTPILVPGEPIDRALDTNDLPVLLAACDAIVLCASLNMTTRHLLDADAFRAFRRGAFLVNVARGGLVDQDALVEALRSGQVGGAFLDVTTPEPMPTDHPLRAAPNVFIAPHVSGDTEEAWERMIDLFVANVRRYRDGHQEFMLNRVDPAHHA